MTERIMAGVNGAVLKMKAIIEKARATLPGTLELISLRLVGTVA
jgi:hypothetical protein